MSRCCSIYSSFRQKQLNFLLYRQSGEIQEKRILKKWKILLEISSFYMCTKNHNHLMYSSWDTEWDGQNFLSFSAIFGLFTPLNNLENQNFEKMKRAPGDVIILHVYQKWLYYDAWFLRYGVQQTVFFVILGHFLPLFLP